MIAGSGRGRCARGADRRGPRRCARRARARRRARRGAPGMRAGRRRSRSPAPTRGRTRAGRARAGRCARLRRGARDRRRPRGRSAALRHRTSRARARRRARRRARSPRGGSARRASGPPAGGASRPASRSSPLAVERETSSGIPAERDDAQVHVPGEPPVEPHLVFTVAPAQLGCAEVEAVEADRLLQLVRVAVGQEHPRHVGLHHLDRARRVGIGLRAREERDLGVDARRAHGASARGDSSARRFARSSSERTSSSESWEKSR